MILTPAMVAAILLSLGIGILLGWFVQRARGATRAEAERRLAEEQRIQQGALAERLNGVTAQLQEERQDHAGTKRQAELYQADLNSSRTEAATLGERATRVGQLEQELRQLGARLEDEEQKSARLDREVGVQQVRIEEERKQGTEKLQLLSDARETLSIQFRNLANEILEDKSRRFTEQNQTNLGQLLEPLKLRLTEFQKKVEDVYDKEGKDRSALAAQVQNLMSLNQSLSQDAKNLTAALKGQAKTQGNWGELILERVLEASGLRKGFEYRVQDSQLRADGSRMQPDVVIELPGERRLVVDAKVSLNAYDRYASAESDDERAVALRQHLESVRGHIRGLSDKRYQEAYGLQSLDFVLAFVPVEPAFMVAVTQDGELFMDAWQRNVLLVSPSTLLFVVRTVAHLWRQEQQSRNAQDIAKRGAELYDKLRGFVDDLQDVGAKLQQAQKSYLSAEKKLVEGRGSAIRQAEMLRELGVKPNKLLPPELVQLALDSDDSAAITAQQAAPPSAAANAPRV